MIILPLQTTLLCRYVDIVYIWPKNAQLQCLYELKNFVKLKIRVQYTHLFIQEDIALQSPNNETESLNKNSLLNLNQANGCC